jgi:ribosome production factor 1
MVKNPGSIKNKIKRSEVYSKYKQQKKKMKKELRKQKVKEIEALGDKAPPKQIPKTIENTRELDETFVQADDQEVAGDEHDDEFSKYFSNELTPKIMISTRPKCSRKLFPFIGDLMQTIPNSFYYPRGDQINYFFVLITSNRMIRSSKANHLVRDLAKYAAEKKFTHLVILAEKDKACNG